jgi:outer membrane protein
MKNTIAAFALLLGLFTAPLASAQGKIATIDLQKVFDNYFKTKLISQNLENQGKEYKTQREKLIGQYQELNNAYASLREGAADPGISNAEKEKRTKDADAKLVEIRTLEADINDYDKTTATQIRETQDRMKKNIIRDIREKISQIAKSNNYSMFLDTAAEARTETPIVLYTDNSSDLTDQVLTSLNAAQGN